MKLQTLPLTRQHPGALVALMVVVAVVVVVVASVTVVVALVAFAAVVDAIVFYLRLSVTQLV